MKIHKIIILLIFITAFFIRPKPAAAFRFVAWADTKGGTSTLQQESAMIAQNFNPVFTIYPGDVCDSGPNSSCFTTWLNAMNGGSQPGNGLKNKTFPVRGNHDDSSSFWVANFNIALVAANVGATNLSQLNTNLTYSFDYGNSHFVGVDLVDGNVDGISSAQIAWMDQDLTAAENRGLTHAFLFWHGPIYSVANHCCPVNTALNSMLDKHKILSATFHGHEHVVAYIHMNKNRISTITHEYEEIISGDAGAGPNTATSGRYDWWLGSSHGFAVIDVNGNNFTVNFYKLGTTSPVKTYTFTNSGTIPSSVVPTSTPPKNTVSPLPTSPSAKPGDANADGKVDGLDYVIWRNHYSSGSSQSGGSAIGDFNNDSRVDGLDYVVWRNNYGK